MFKKLKLAWALWRAWRKVEHMDKPILKSKTIWAGILGGLAIIIPSALCLLNGTCAFGDILPKFVEGIALILGAIGVRFAIAKNGGDA
jgi:hypothetical protein